MPHKIDTHTHTHTFEYDCACLQQTEHGPEINAIKSKSLIRDRKENEKFCPTFEINSKKSENEQFPVLAVLVCK